MTKLPAAALKIVQLNDRTTAYTVDTPDGPVTGLMIFLRPLGRRGEGPAAQTVLQGAAARPAEGVDHATHSLATAAIYDWLVGLGVDMEG